MWSSKYDSPITNQTSDISRFPDFDDEEDSHAMMTNEIPEVRYITLLSYTIAFVIGLCGNTLVIYIIGRFRQVRRKSVANYYIWNLAFADEMYVLSLPMFSWVTYAGRWPFDGSGLGSLSCKAAYIARDINKLASVYTLVALSIDRWLASYHGLGYLRTIRVGKIVCSSIWVICGLISTPYMMYADIRMRSTGGGNSSVPASSCKLNWPSPVAASVWTWFQLIFGLVFPSILILAAYARLFRRLRQISERNGGAAMSSVVRPSKRMIQTVLVVVVAFIICQTPYHIMQFINLNKMRVVDEHQLIGVVYRPSSYQVYATVYTNIFAQILVFASSCCNPVIYGLLNENYRRLYRIVICRCCRSRCNTQQQIDYVVDEKYEDVVDVVTKLRFEITFHSPFSKRFARKNNDFLMEQRCPRRRSNSIDEPLEMEITMPTHATTVQ